MTRALHQLRATGEASLGRVSATATHLPGGRVRYAEPVTGRPSARPIRLPAVDELPQEVLDELVPRVHVDFSADDSGSMYGPYGDPDGVRYAVAASVCQLLRKHAPRSGGSLASVVHWGTHAPEDQRVGPIDLADRPGRKQLEAALTIPPSLGGNDMARALRASAAMHRGDGAGTIPFTFVLTDGIEPVTDDTRQALSELRAGSVHMLLIDRSNGCSEAMERTWRSLPLASFTRLNTWDTRTLAMQVRTSLVDALAEAGATDPRAAVGTVSVLDTTRRKES